MIEKLIVVLLCDICSGEKSLSKKELNKIKSAIMTGNSWALREWYPEMASDERISSAASEAREMLSMWRDIETSPVGVEFPGFCPIAEKKHLNAARFLVENFDAFAHFRGRALEAGIEQLHGYRRMIAIYRCVLTSKGRSMTDDVQLMLGTITQTEDM